MSKHGENLRILQYKFSVENLRGPYNTQLQKKKKERKNK